jgi:hypothetical protein
MSTNKITGVGDPTSAQDVATKVYTDTQRDTRVAKSGDTMSGALAMGNNKITGLATPTATTDATTKTYVDGLFQSTTAAATSASNAATSESNAATSATNASNSAASALTSKNAAATSLATFQNQYLGAQGSAPTADPDGSALDVGDLYFDTTAGAMKVYSANGWTNAGSSVNGTTNRYSYTATAGQTVFAATYDSGYVDVFLNGVKQLVGTDVTATSGTSVVFASGTTVNDIVEIVGYGTFVLSDHLTQTQSDARYVQVAGDTMTGNLSFGDNDKAIFGAGSDLQIYHDGSNSYVQDTAAGELILKSNGPSISFQKGDGTELFTVNTSGSSTLSYSGNAKLATTSTGVDITGGVTTNAYSYLNGLRISGADTGNTVYQQSGDLSISSASGSISLKPSGTNILHATNTGVGIGTGTSSPSSPLQIQSSNNQIRLVDSQNTSMYCVIETISDAGLSFNADVGGAAVSSRIQFNVDNSEKMRIDNDGNVIATSGSLNLVGTNTQIFASSNGDDIQFKFSGTKKASINNGGLISASDGSAVVPGFRFVDDPNTGMYRSASDTISFSTAGAERMRIRPDGAVRIYDSGQLGDTSGTPLILGNKNVSKQMEIGVNDSALTNPYITIIGRNSGNSTARLMSIGVQADSQYSYITDSSNSHDLRIYAGGNVVPSGNVVMGNGLGIDFSATSNGSSTEHSELLNDYEEGTFTYTLAGGTSGGWTSRTGYATGRYTKVGRVVHIQVRFEALNSGRNSPQGNLQITGFPFATSNHPSSGNGSFQVPVLLRGDSASNVASHFMSFGHQSTTGTFFQQTTGSTTISAVDSNADTTGAIEGTVSFSYVTDS